LHKIRELKPRSVSGESRKTDILTCFTGYRAGSCLKAAATANLSKNKPIPLRQIFPLSGKLAARREFIV
jgi:hypothetical protein